MKTILFILVLFMASCSEDSDPKPKEQISCSELMGKIELAQKAILDHQNKGSQGNPSAWETELKRLTVERNKLSNEYKTRHCL